MLSSLRFRRLLHVTMQAGLDHFRRESLNLAHSLYGFGDSLPPVQFLDLANESVSQFGPMRTSFPSRLLHNFPELERQCGLAFFCDEVRINGLQYLNCAVIGDTPVILNPLPRPIRFGCPVRPPEAPLHPTNRRLRAHREFKIQTILFPGLTAVVGLHVNAAFSVNQSSQVCVFPNCLGIVLVVQEFLRYHEVLSAHYINAPSRAATRRRSRLLVLASVVLLRMRASRGCA